MNADKTIPVRTCVVRDLGRMSYAEALSVQESIADERKAGLGVDHLLFVEHPHVVTIGRMGGRAMSWRRLRSCVRRALRFTSRIAAGM